MLLLDFMEACEGVTSDSSQGTAYIISSLDEINEKTVHLCLFFHTITGVALSNFKSNLDTSISLALECQNTV